MVNIVSGAAVIAAVERVWFFIFLCQNSLHKGGGKHPEGAVIHIQKIAPAPPRDTAATTPTRFPMPTRVAVEMMRVWREERLSGVSFFSFRAFIMSENRRTGRSIFPPLYNPIFDSCLVK